MLRRTLRWGPVLVVLLYLAGCATYGEGMDETIQQVEQGKYQQASQSLEENLDSSGDDELLYHLELGSIKHLSGDFQASNKHLEEAHNLADSLRSKQAGDYLAAAMTNPRKMAYMGNDVERVYINYSKSLNYLMLAQQAGDADARSDFLEKAKVELRRLDNTLSSISFEKGNYKSVKDKEEKTFAKLMDLFQKFQGNWLDQDWLVFRDDAYVRYLAGALYEKSGDLDDARIAYQKAAELYEQGYTKQYYLQGGMAERAWFDTIRMMRSSGAWEGEWQRFAADKLSQEWRDKLEDYGPDSAQLLVVQHLGMVPQRKEMNLHMTALPGQQALRLKPRLGGTSQEQADKLGWFFLLYGDKGVMNMLTSFSDGGLQGVAESFSSKTVTLGPAWELAEQLRVPQAIGNSGIRVTVPYYSPLRTACNGSHLEVNGKRVGTFRQAENIYQLFLQNQLLNASSDLQAAMARATLKNVVGAEAGAALGGFWGRLGGKVLASGTSAAETRNWLTLPYEVRLVRVPLEPGSHIVSITTLTESGNRIAHRQHNVEVEAGDIRVLVERTMDPTQQRPDRKAGVKPATAQQRSQQARHTTTGSYSNLARVHEQ